MSLRDDLYEGCVIQIASSDDGDMRIKFGGCLLVVREVKDWGVVGYIPVRDHMHCPLRVEWADIAGYVGEAVYS